MARIDGFVVSEDATDVRVSGVGSIPSDDDLGFVAALGMRERLGREAGRGVTVAVIDTGLGAAIARWLRDAGILAGAYSKTGGNPTASTHSHGSHVATLATPDGARLLHYQALGEDGSGSSSGIISSIYDAVERGADIINMSLGGSGGGSQYETAIRHARSRGVLVVCAAGNTGREEAHYPASCPSAISVSAYDRQTGAKASFATFHETVDFASSGVSVLAYGASGSLVRMSGSSQAAPIWTFVAAMLMGDTGRSGEEILQAMRSGAKDMFGPATYDGSGLVQGSRARKKLRGKERKVRNHGDQGGK